MYIDNMKKSTDKKMALSPEKEAAMAFTKKNYMLVLIGLAIIIIGFVLMSGGGSPDPANEFTGDELFSFRRITLAPIVVIGGFVFVGYAIMRRAPRGER